MTNEQLWQTALGEIELNISRANFITWFRDTFIFKNKEGVATIGVPNGFSKEWLENKYNKLILRAIRNVSSDIKELRFIIVAASSSVSSPTERIIKTPGIKGTPVGQAQSFQELEIDKDTNLNPKYTFSNFIVGSFNELAQAAAKAVVNNPGEAYNPLFIYGGTGLGKTHLLQAIGNEVIEKYKKKKRVKYISSEKFTSELVSSLHNGKIEEFKENYRQVDILIIDDIQFLSGKEKTQEEFFHTFNFLYQKNKQVILSSDRSPKAIATLEERLRSRFEGGMITDISQPDMETRLAILKCKTIEKKIVIPDEILAYIAAHVQKNIRELEGALNRIIAANHTITSNPDMAVVAKILNDIINAPKKLTNHKNIIQAVAEFYDISAADLIHRCRRKEVVGPRQVAMYLMREELKKSFPFIGEKLGGRDHTTVMYACDKLTKEVEKNEMLQQELNLIKEKIYSK
ncbi:MAG: chromosomal replication initiator protein DnaA [Candidatus Portnoybacteria bacterium]|nr:chromosomal replication initiator protein DnaA [Candidatus Portnoybacteria bacterium]MDD4982711.1 chromosomal replication initiator protein DnaA [Candidatus Portnoybacteria bacterium]